MENMIKSQLLPDEKIMWEGKPDKIYYLSMGPSLSFIVIPALMLLIAGYWEMALWQAGDIYSAAILGTFILWILYMFVGRLFVANLECNGLYYAITNKRAIIQRGILKTEFETIDIKSVSDIRMNANTSGVGDIVFLKGEPQPPSFFEQLMGREVVFGYVPGMPMQRSMLKFAPTFYGIENAKELYAIIQSLRVA